MNHLFAFTFILALLAFLCLAGCVIAPGVSYQHDVHPIFEQKCIDCHTPPYGEGYRMTGLDMQDYDSLVKGSIYGPVIVPGDSRRSTLNMLVEGRAGNLSRVLKIKHEPMTEHEIEVLRLWVEQGARNN